MTIGYGINPDTDPHRSNPSVHYRLYDHPKQGPRVICVQDFDYPDYDERRIMTADAYDVEADADAALRAYLGLGPTQPAHGASDDIYPDIPSEYLTGLANGKLGDWLQEVHDAGWYVHIPPTGFHSVSISNMDQAYWGEDDATNRVDIMLTRAYLAWKGREVSV